MGFKKISFFLCFAVMLSGCKGDFNQPIPVTGIDQFLENDAETDADRYDVEIVAMGRKTLKTTYLEKFELTIYDYVDEITQVYTFKLSPLERINGGFIAKNIRSEEDENISIGGTLYWQSFNLGLSKNFHGNLVLSENEERVIRVRYQFIY